MAYEKPILSDARPVAADLSAKRYYAVKLSGANLALCDTAGEDAFGILQDEPDNTTLTTGTAMVSGISRAMMGGSGSAGDPLTPKADGTLTLATIGDFVLARAAEDYTTGQIHAVEITKEGQKSGYVMPVVINLNAATGDILTSLALGHKGTIEAVDGYVKVAGAGAGADVSINLEIGAVDLTGGVVNATIGNAATLGAKVAGTTVTANNQFSASDVISIETAVATAFTAGELILMIRISND